MWKLIAACLAVAGLSLLLPSEPSYDPWGWLVWGRELAQFRLDTAGGPSWKPLPVAFTTLTAPFGRLDEGLPPALWIVVARAGTLLALAMAFRLAGRLAGGGAAGVLAGAVAAVALFLTPDWFQFAAQGSEAPLAVALMLWAVERHLDGRPGHALVLGLLTCLMRPELVPFLGLYGAWAWFTEPRLRPLLAGALVLLPAAWVVPEWIGSGNPLDGGRQARSEPVWSLSLAEHPWLRALERFHNHAGVAVELLALTGLIGALARRGRAVPVLAAAALAEIALYVAMTQLGFSGNPRYVLPALTLLCVLAGVGAAQLVELRLPRVPRPAGVAAGLAAICVLGAPLVDERAAMLADESRQVGQRMRVHADLARAVDRVGGPGAVAAIGTATANRALHSRLAWELELPMDAVESVSDHRVIFRSRLELLAGHVYMKGRARTRRTMARVGSIRVYRRDGITFPKRRRRLVRIGAPFTGLLQGIHTRTESGRNSAFRVVTR